jgi:hypothetical protein
MVSRARNAQKSLGKFLQSRVQCPVTEITNAAHALLYPDKKYVVVPEAEDGFVVLPDSFAPFLGTFPELGSFLIGQAKADPANFLHMALVGDLSLKVGRDWVRLFPNKQQNMLWSGLKFRSPFAFMHDNGKTLVGRDFEASRALVYPANYRNRPPEENGLHWAHPAFGALALQALAQATPEVSRQSIHYWSLQTALHHSDFTPFAHELTQAPVRSFGPLDWAAHLLFTIADVSVAMRLERPSGNGVYGNEDIMKVLARKHLSDDNLRPFVPRGLHAAFLRSYLTQSLFSHLDTLRERYSPADCRAPEGFVARGFYVDCRSDSVEVNQLARFCQALWRAHERDFMAPIERMDEAGVLRLR